MFKPEQINKNLLTICLPALLVAVMIISYFFFYASFAKCWKLVQCQPIDGTLIYQIDEPLKLSEAVNKISNIKAAVNNADNVYKSSVNAKMAKDSEVTNLQSQINAQNEFANAQPANANAFNTNVNKLTAELSKQKADTALLENNTNQALSNKQKLEKEVVAVRTNVSDRYSQRVIWLFLSWLIFGLFMATVVILWSITKSNAQTKPIFWVTIAFAILVFIVFIATDGFFSPSLNLFEQSIIANNDISSNGMLFSNAFVFASIVILVGAACANLYSFFLRDEKTNNSLKASEQIIKANQVVSDETVVLDENGLPVPASPAVNNAKRILQEYVKPYRNYARLILYFGSGLLLSGLLRMQVLNNWHSNFLTKEYSTLLGGFFNSLVSTQAAFYTLILMAIYLPMAYSITSESPTDKGFEETIQEDGFIKTINEFTLRFLALISPFLAGPISKIFNYLIGTNIPAG